jgi:glycosyl-4,4'-diaponeurosporenoate acyltransferase
VSGLPLVELPWWAVAGGNVVAWAVFHSATGLAVHALPLARLDRDGPVLRLRRWERDGEVYRRLRIKAWKDRLPEAGDLFRGGVTKRRLPAATRPGLLRFAAETRRAERGHWLAMACGPLALLWNPPIGAAAMIAYGVAVNAPFIAVQRYNRARVARVVRRPARSSGSASV